MVNSNERGRALEYRISIELVKIFESMKLETIFSESTIRLNFRDINYFNALDKKTQEDFGKCARVVGNWFKKQPLFFDAETVTIDRFGDDKAKTSGPTDIQLGILTKNGELIRKNFSLKHNHNALCHPRLPSLAQQCGFEKDSKIDLQYRKKYSKIWNNFENIVKKLNPKIKTYSQLDKINPLIKYDSLYVPLMKHTVKFMQVNCNQPKNVVSLFNYLVGNVDYIVIKNETNNVVLKYFNNFKEPNKLIVKYPNKFKNHLLLLFDNNWVIDSRIHTASSRIFKDNGEIFKTEKIDPICSNLNELIKIETISKV